MISAWSPLDCLRSKTAVFNWEGRLFAGAGADLQVAGYKSPKDRARKVSWMNPIVERDESGI